MERAIAPGVQQNVPSTLQNDLSSTQTKFENLFLKPTYKLTKQQKKHTTNNISTYLPTT